jgi:UDP-GlcNAc:undecaprenyl-phosphate GlcNAc-1-phosphate transferase
MTSLLWIFVGASLTSLGLTRIVRAAAYRHGRFERAGDALAVAQSPPRLGGIAVALTWVATVAVTALVAGDALRAALDALPLVPILVGAALVFAVGLADDLRPVPPAIKISVETLAASVVIGAGILIVRFTAFDVTVGLGWMSVVATMAWILMLTNAFNLIDGLDGLATGLAIIAAFTCTAIVIARGDLATAVLLVALLGALVGFLPFNFNPASIFLGDGGSLFIGFMLAVTAITGFQKGATALASAAPLLIFGLPLLDVGVTIIRRLRGNRPSPEWRLRAALSRLLQADRQHLHHQLLSRGLTHRHAVLMLYGIAILLAVLAFASADL